MKPKAREFQILIIGSVAFFCLLSLVRLIQFSIAKPINRFRRLFHQCVINVKLEDGELTDNLYVVHNLSVKCFIFLFSKAVKRFVGLGKIKIYGWGGGGEFPTAPNFNF